MTRIARGCDVKAARSAGEKSDEVLVVEWWRRGVLFWKGKPALAVQLLRPPFLHHESSVYVNLGLAPVAFSRGSSVLASNRAAGLQTGGANVPGRRRQLLNLSPYASTLCFHRKVFFCLVFVLF